MPIPDAFRRALSTHDMSFAANHAEQLAAYCELLWEWNNRLNLTRHVDFESFVTRDLPDCLQLADLLNENESVLDVGSGGGVPGAVLAILRPDLTMTLAESTQKKAIALEAIAKELNLPVEVCPDRGEDVLRRRSFDTVTARAVAPLRKLVPLFRPQRKRFRRLLLVKGPNWAEERTAAEEAGVMKSVRVEPVADYATPGRDGHSVILEVIL